MRKKDKGRKGFSSLQNSMGIRHPASCSEMFVFIFFPASYILKKKKKILLWKSTVTLTNPAGAEGPQRAILCIRSTAKPQHHPACLRQNWFLLKSFVFRRGSSRAWEAAERTHLCKRLIPTSGTSQLLQPLSTQGNLLILAALLAGDTSQQPLYQDSPQNKTEYILYMMSQNPKRAWGPILQTQKGG